MIRKHIFTAFLLLVVTAGCGRQEYLALPSAAEIKDIQVLIPPFDQFGLTTNRYSVKGNDYAKILSIFASAQRVRCSTKWLALGTITITPLSGDIFTIDLYSTRGLSAFNVNGKYYQGSSDRALFDAIKQTGNHLKSENESVEQAVSGYPPQSVGSPEP